MLEREKRKWNFNFIVVQGGLRVFDGIESFFRFSCRSSMQQVDEN